MTFEHQRKVALLILSSDMGMTRKAGSFLGQCIVDEAPLSEKQHNWFLQLAERAGVFVEGKEHA